MALTNKLSAIGDAIREKTGKSALLTLDQMPEEIKSIVSGGGGGDLPEETLVITGDCSYRFANGGWDWFIDMYGNQITTNNINKSTYMFNNTQAKNIPFEINLAPNISNFTFAHMFAGAGKLEEIPKINCNGTKPISTTNLFNGCSNLRYIPEDIVDWFDFSLIENSTVSYTYTRDRQFTNCSSLRKIPMSFLKCDNPNINYSNSIYAGLMSGCYNLDDVIGLPIPNYKAAWTGNTFSSTASGLFRVKDFIFETNEDGSPKKVSWKNQTLALSDTGWCGFNVSYYIIGYNSGITADKEVKDDATYQALKNDPDWFTLKAEYSRYNHDSAVATINSLPDASEYLATAGGTNTIKFKGAAGSKTDGGAINTLTEEEIAVAAAKGWTVSLV
jgi:hypothetical protein